MLHFYLQTISKMSITNFQISKCRRHREVWKRRLLVALALDFDEVIVHSTVHRLVTEEENISRLKLRRWHVQTCFFNLNAFSDHQCLTDFRFKRADIGMLCTRFHWPGITAWSEYRCNLIAAFCVFLHRIQTTSRLFDLEEKFGLFALELGEIFREHVELCVQQYGHTRELRPNFFRPRASAYASTLFRCGSPLENTIGFIHRSKIPICRPENSTTNQQVVYSGQKRMHCLTYQTISTAHGLIASLYVLLDVFVMTSRYFARAGGKRSFRRM